MIRQGAASARATFAQPDRNDRTDNRPRVVAEPRGGNLSESLASKTVKWRSTPCRVLLRLGINAPGGEHADFSETPPPRAYPSSIHSVPGLATAARASHRSRSAESVHASTRAR